jgi:hypothetical protein
MFSSPEPKFKRNRESEEADKEKKEKEKEKDEKAKHGTAVLLITRWKALFTDLSEVPWNLNGCLLGIE